MSLAAVHARAADPADLPPSAGSSQAGSTGLESVDKVSYWGRGASRPFLSTVVDVGFVYFRPQLALGYGKPHFSWIGVETYSSLSGGGGADYVGLHAALPYLELRGGARYFFAVNRDFLRPQDSYARVDVEKLLTQPSRYVALEAEIAASVPLPGGDLFALVTGYAVTDVPDDFYVYEESLHAIMKPPYIGRLRLGYVFRFGPKDAISLGALIEGIDLVGRKEAVLRAGPVAKVTLTPNLEALATFAFVASSPDEIGLVGADAGQFGLRYRWATGTRAPHVVW